MSPPARRDDPGALRANLRRVLAGLRWPAARWEVIAEADAWGVTGGLRARIVSLPDGRYPSLDVLVQVLVDGGRPGLRSATGAADRPGRAVAHRRIAPAPPAGGPWRRGRSPA